MPFKLNPFTDELDLINEESSGDEINVETIVGDKYLDITDKRYQWLSFTGSKGLYITNDDGVAGDRFVIRNNNSYTFSGILYLYVQGSLLDYIHTGRIIELIHNGTTWVAARMGSPENTLSRFNLMFGVRSRGYSRGVALGYNARGYSYGVAVGYNADGYSYGVGVGYYADGYLDGVAIGYLADGYNKGVGIGRSAKGYNSSVAVGYYAEAFGGGVAVGRNAGAGDDGIALGQRAVGNNEGIAIGLYADTSWKKQSVALGNYTICTRTCENCTNITAKNFPAYKGSLGWFGVTDNSNWVEIYLGGIAGERLVLADDSVLTYKIMVTAKQKKNSHNVAYYDFEGIIRTDGAGNISHPLNTKTVKYEDSATWDCDLVVGSSALQIRVLGGHNVDIAWVAKGEFIEIKDY